MLVEESLNETSKLLCNKIEEIFSKSNNNCLGIKTLIEAMRYCSLANGKRIRPFLTIETAKIFGVEIEKSLQAAVAIELIHTYSLIHDDLPSIDNDSIRRNQPSCHIKYNESIAILTGDALLTFAFELLSDESTHIDANIRCKLIKSISKRAGFKGMVGGQASELLLEKKDFDIKNIINIQKMKTGEMFAVSCQAGAIIGNAPKNLCDSLCKYAYDLGLIFQILDDIQDLENDKKTSKTTFVTLMGIEKSKEYIDTLAKQAIKHLDIFKEKGVLLIELLNYIRSL